MTKSPQPEDLLFQVLLRLFGRSPRPLELQHWAAKLADAPGAAAFLKALSQAPAFAENAQVRMHNQAGHPSSPIVDPESVRAHVAQARTLRSSDIAGIDFPLDEMAEFWLAHREFIAATPFTEEPDGIHRYCYRGGPYNHGDAVMLRALIGAHRPRRVIEIGSGYTTACMLDSAEEIGLDDLVISSIDIDHRRLKSLLRPGDERRLEIFEQPAQTVPRAAFAQLERHDILFIDSSHALKTGSDVQYLLFDVVPLLRPGVLVHFHDCRFPFEYSDRQIFEKNYSWNEAYAVRALLMWSNRLRVIFYSSLFALERRHVPASIFPVFLTNPGSSIWLQVQSY
jgi:predicted O-methyltransferase YrrM